MAPSLPKSYKAAIFKEKGAPLTIEEVELKHPGEGEILIKVLACGVCGSDHVVQQGLMGNPLSVYLLFRACLIIAHSSQPYGART